MLLKIHIFGMQKEALRIYLIKFEMHTPRNSNSIYRNGLTTAHTYGHVGKSAHCSTAHSSKTGNLNKPE